MQGARSSVQRAQAVPLEKATAEQIWIRSLAARMPFGKVLAAEAGRLVLRPARPLAARKQ